MRTSEQISELIAALAAARPAFTPVTRESVGQVGQSRSYKYADLAVVLEATMPALAKAGVVVLQAVDAETSTLITRVAHTSGQWVESAYPLAAYERPQEYGSQLTYARRYSLLALLTLAQVDDDGASAQRAERPPRPAPAGPIPAPAVAPCAESGTGPVTKTSVIRDVEASHGTSRGKSWRRWRVAFADGTAATTFEPAVGEAAVEAHAAGLAVKHTTVFEAKGRKLVALVEADDAPALADAAGDPF